MPSKAPRRGPVPPGILLAAVLALGPWVQGCTLLFVAKSEVRYIQDPAPTVVPAASLSRQMSGRVVLRYKVRPGDTLRSIALLYYGDPSRAARVASDNHLRAGARLREGRTLRIVDPLDFPGPRDLEKKGPAGTAAAPEPGPISHLDLTPENITAVPRPKEDRAFGPGEKLQFEVRALSMVGGYGTLAVGDPVSVQGRPCYPLTARATAAFPFSALFQVHDVQTSFFDMADFLTLEFENDVLEGKHRSRNSEVYDQVRHRAVRVEDGRPAEGMDVAPFTQDIISCFYYFRLLPLKVGCNYSIPVQSAGHNYKLIVEVIKRERISVPAGTYDCLLIKPHVRYATVFRNTDDIDIWVTDDRRHLPVLVRSKIFIGSVQAALIKADLPKGRDADGTGP